MVFLFASVFFAGTFSGFLALPTAVVVSLTASLYLILLLAGRDSPFRHTPVLCHRRHKDNQHRNKDNYKLDLLRLTPLFSSDPEFTRHGPEVPAILWLLQVTTEPQAMAAAAGLTLEVQWNTVEHLNLQWDPEGPYHVFSSALSSLGSSFHGCLLIHPGTIKLRAGTDQLQNALLYGKTYLVLLCVVLLGKPNDTRAKLLKSLIGANSKFERNWEQSTELEEWQSLYMALTGSPTFFRGIHSSAVDWALEALPAIPGCDSRSLPLFLVEFKPEKMTNAAQSYPRFLYALNILLGLHTDARDFFIQDKSTHIGRLTTTMFRCLAKWIGKVPEGDQLSIAINILTTTADFARLLDSNDRKVDMDVAYLKLITNLCGVFPADQWIDAIFSTLLLNTEVTLTKNHVDLALEAQKAMSYLLSTPTVTEANLQMIRDSLRYLLLNPTEHLALPSSTTWEAIQKILDLNNESSILMFLVLCTKTRVKWFKADDLGVQGRITLWQSLGKVVLQNRKLAQRFVTWVEGLYSLEEDPLLHWRPAIHHNFNQLLHAYLFIDADLGSCAAFLGRLWGGRRDGTTNVVHEAVCNLWMNSQVDQDTLNRFITLAHILEDLSNTEMDSTLPVDEGRSTRHLLSYMRTQQADNLSDTATWEKLQTMIDEVMSLIA
ncbi:hypothetical protein C8F04DRAFT_1148104 [Mycena alexandri]|uniref:Uncharacterized protein n=1 Tax=Mycena alexandri TaxID=1745969 RepID=A0AAD6WNK9_9AGAR|nr:hypothetical protein C8F04DRAFT_1148104 [Mycena alexandri]